MWLAAAWAACNEAGDDRPQELKRTVFSHVCCVLQASPSPTVLLKKMRYRMRDAGCWDRYSVTSGRAKSRGGLGNDRTTSHGEDACCRETFETLWGSVPRYVPSAPVAGWVQTGATGADWSPKKRYLQDTRQAVPSQSKTKIKWR